MSAFPCTHTENDLNDSSCIWRICINSVLRTAVAMGTTAKRRIDSVILSKGLVVISASNLKGGCSLAKYDIKKSHLIF